MKAFAVILLLAMSVQAQSIADAARKERARQANVKPVVVITGIGQNAGTVPSVAQPQAPKPQGPVVADPAKLWNDQQDQLRTKIRMLQDEETALQFKQNDLTNQVYAVVTDQATKDQAQTQLAQVQEQLATVRKDLDVSKKTLDDMQLQGPPKK